MSNNILEAQIELDKTRDAQSYDRYPVRFLFTNVEDFQSDDTLQFMVDKNVVFLSDLAIKNNNHDGWITRTEFINAVKNAAKNYPCQDTVIIGFSEYARFLKNPEFESTILTLFDIENCMTNEQNRKRRIYILCFSLKEQIYAVLEKKHKRFELFNPFINKDFSFSENEIKDLYFTNKSMVGLFESNANIIKESQEWLALCRNAATFDLTKPIICVSDVLYEWYTYAYPDNAFQIDVINNYEDYISKIYDINLYFDCSEKDVLFWRELVDILYENKDIKDVDALTRIMLNTSDLDVNNLLYCWINAQTDLKKWYIREYIITYRKESFIGKIMRICNGNTNNSLFDAFWNVSKRDLTSENLVERKTLCGELVHYSLFSVPEDRIIEDVITDLKDIVEFSLNASGYVESSELETANNKIRGYFDNYFLPYVTGYSNAEKIIIIYLVSTGVYSLNEIENYYPELYAYFGYEDDSISDLDTYFANYKLSKITGHDTLELKTLIDRLNNNEFAFYDWYYSLSTQSKLLRDYQKNEHYSVYIIDGLGAEYLSLLCYIIDNSKGYKVSTKEYATSHLPTVTDLNKHYIKDYKEWITDFDFNVIHGDYYKFAKNINKAITTLTNIVNGIINREGGNGFIITSDHGATARARWTTPNKRYSFNNSEHEGRCCQTTQEIESNNDYFVYQDNGGLEKKYVIALRDISLNNNPKYEAHGGASPEEVVVPFVIADSVNKEDKGYIVTPIDFSVTGLDKHISFSVSPAVGNVFVIEEDGTRLKATNEHGVWTVELQSGKQQRISIVVANKKHQFDVISSAKSFIEEDDGFDD